MCPVCGGQGYLLGPLGGLVWLRCQCCGMQYCQSAEDWREYVPETEDSDESLQSGKSG
jgi:hypothetical protein